jgi:hypothetical protein
MVSKPKTAHPSKEKVSTKNHGGRKQDLHNVCLSLSSLPMDWQVNTSAALSTVGHVSIAVGTVAYTDQCDEPYSDNDDVGWYLAIPPLMQ